MYIVTDVKIAYVPDDYQFMHRTHEPLETTVSVFPSALDKSNVRVTSEEIKGRRFQLYDRTYVIGWSEDVQRALGVPLDNMEALTQEIQRLTKENHKLKQ